MTKGLDYFVLLPLFTICAVLGYLDAGVVGAIMHPLAALTIYYSIGLAGGGTLRGLTPFVWYD